MPEIMTADMPETVPENYKNNKRYARKKKHNVSIHAGKFCELWCQGVDHWKQKKIAKQT